MNGGILLVEPTTPYFHSLFKVRRVLAYERSKYQEIALVELEGFGRALVIDKLIQSTEKDEYIYHELLVHPAMAIHSSPRRVLILGGGEGAALREVLKHGCVERVVLVDIDEVVVEFSKKYLEYIHGNSFYDSRVEVVIMNGYDYVLNASSGSFDVVIMDLTDPYTSEVAKPLYTREFFEEVRRVLSADGVVATQAGNSFFYNKSYLNVRESARRVFEFVAEYWAWIPSFAYACNFIVGSKRYDPLSVDPETFNARLSARGVETKFVSGDRLAGLLRAGIVVSDLER